MEKIKFISIVTPCYNEEENVAAVHEQVKAVFGNLGKCTYEHIFIDNASKDRTVPILKDIARRDKNVKIIVNNRNFGHIRSPYYGLLQARGDAVISIAADLQDPPEMIKDFLAKWEEGYKVVIGVKASSEESPLFFAIRKLYYAISAKLSDVKLVKNYTGFGLYGRDVMETIGKIDDRNPYFRGLIADLGYETAQIEYTQPSRKRGISKNNFYTLYDLAMLGIATHSKVPLRITTMVGFACAALSFLTAFVYLVYKLIFWDTFVVGIAPVTIGLFFFSSVQLIFLGIVGEYIGSIHTQVLNRPLVVEKERINFDTGIQDVKNQVEKTF